MTNVCSVWIIWSVTCDTARWRLLGLDLSALGADIVSWDACYNVKCGQTASGKREHWNLKKDWCEKSGHTWGNADTCGWWPRSRGWWRTPWWRRGWSGPCCAPRRCCSPSPRRVTRRVLRVRAGIMCHCHHQCHPHHHCNWRNQKIGSYSVVCTRTGPSCLSAKG